MSIKCWNVHFLHLSPNILTSYVKYGNVRERIDFSYRSNVLFIFTISPVIRLNVTIETSLFQIIHLNEFYNERIINKKTKVNFFFLGQVCTSKVNVIMINVSYLYKYMYIPSIYRFISEDECVIMFFFFFHYAFTCYCPSPTRSKVKCT